MNKDRAAYQAFVDHLAALAGVKSSSALARKAGFAPSTLNRFLGEKPVKHTLSTKTIEGLAKAAGLSAVAAHQLLARALEGGVLPHLSEDQALYGDGSPLGQHANNGSREPQRDGSGMGMVPLVGYVGAGAQIHQFDGDQSSERIDEVEAPPGADDQTVAVIVSGDSMFPRYLDHETIYYSRAGASADPAGAIGREVVVRLADGRTFVKVLRRGFRPGYFNLDSYNAAPMEDVVIEWVVPVKWVKRD